MHLPTLTRELCGLSPPGSRRAADNILGLLPMGSLGTSFPLFLHYFLIKLTFFTGRPLGSWFRIHYSLPYNRTGSFVLVCTSESSGLVGALRAGTDPPEVPWSPPLPPSASLVSHNCRNTFIKLQMPLSSSPFPSRRCSSAQTLPLYTPKPTISFPRTSFLPFPSFLFRPPFSFLPSCWGRALGANFPQFPAAVPFGRGRAAHTGSSTGGSLRGRAARGEEAAGSERGPGREGP